MSSVSDWAPECAVCTALQPEANTCLISSKCTPSKRLINIHDRQPDVRLPGCHQYCSLRICVEHFASVLAVSRSDTSASGTKNTRPPVTADHTKVSAKSRTKVDVVLKPSRCTRIEFFQGRYLVSNASYTSGDEKLKYYQSIDRPQSLSFAR